MSAIEKELLEALGKNFKPKAKEERQVYLARLKSTVQDSDVMSDEDWEKLTEPAQAWVNAAAKADNADKELPDFPDAEEADEEEPAPKKKAAKDDETETEESEDEVAENVKKKAPAKKPAAEKEAPAKKKAVEKEAPAKKPAAEKEKPAKSGKLEGIKVDIKTMVIKKPSLSADDIYEALGGKKAELSKVTISAVRSETRHTLRVLNQMGKLDIKV